MRERRRFSTIGAQTSHGPWRATAVWQRDQRKRAVEPVPTQRWVALLVGRELLWGFGIDIGAQHAVTAREKGGTARVWGVVSRLGHRAAF